MTKLKFFNKQKTEAQILKKIAYLRNVKGAPKLAAKALKKYLGVTPAKMRSARLYLILANLYVDIGETRKAFAAFRLAARKSRNAADELMLSDVLRKWGYLYLHTETDLARAKEKIEESVMIINKLLEKDFAKEVFAVAANCYASLGNYCHASGNKIAAKAAYQKAHDFAERAGFKERAVTILGDLGNIAIEEKQWREAEVLLRDVSKRAKKYYQHALPAALLRLGRLFSDPENPNRDISKATQFFNKSLVVARRSGWRREEADALFELGKKTEAETIYKKIGYKRHINLKKKAL